MDHHIVLYTKPGCHLCDVVLDDLQLLGYEMDLTVKIVDITTDPALLERFHALIPVVDIDGGPLLTSPITIGRLREALTETLESPNTAAFGQSIAKGV